MSRFHIVGIGGAGMSAIARVLLERGHTISGSDTGHWPLSDALARDGARVYDTFEPRHIDDADTVIRSSAYKEDNAEVRAARERGIAVWRRHEAWQFLTKGQRVIAVAGTHGKSTTTAMSWAALHAAGIDASLICGAALRELGTNAHAGERDVFVIEADEYDNTFLALQPQVAVVTTLDHDHIDLFPTREDYREAFRAFVRGIAAGGTLIASEDDGGARELAAWAKKATDAKVVTYRAYTGRLAVPGEHNARNAAAALSAASLVGADRDAAARGVASFTGVERRLETIGVAGNVTVIDDYAHHPAEIAAGLDAYGYGAVVVFQPHTPSRLLAFFDEFATVLKRARAVVIVETFRSAREQADPHGRARALAEAVGGKYAKDGETAALLAAELARSGDAVLVMGAGDVRPVGQRVLELLRTPV